MPKQFRKNFYKIMKTDRELRFASRIDVTHLWQLLGTCRKGSRSGNWKIEIEIYNKPLLYQNFNYVFANYEKS